MAADVGTLQRMPKAIGSISTFNELAYTARKFDSLEAKNIGFVSQVYDTNERYSIIMHLYFKLFIQNNIRLKNIVIFSMIENVINIASNIASKSPVGIQMTKRSIIYSRDHSVQEGLNHIVS